MNVAIVTGSAGLVGSEACRFLHEKGFAVAGVDNDMRSAFFGPAASTRWRREELEKSLRNYRHHAVDVRNREQIEAIFKPLGRNIGIVVHAAAQPSHDWATGDPMTDFSVNALGTLVLLEAARRYAPDASFIFTSTNKVYGDAPNQLPLRENETRWEVDPAHPYAAEGIDESMSIDRNHHSIFGASKVAADVMVQEYGRHFGMKTACFRCGCVTGPAHSSAELHGFLSYVMKCAVTGDCYTIYGYKGKQVRDNIHAYDLVRMFWHFFENPRHGEVYNAGGGRHANCSVREAIALCEEISGRKMNVRYTDGNRPGDHIWWISDVRRFRTHYPGWNYSYDLRGILREIHSAMRERFSQPEVAGGM